MGMPSHACDLQSALRHSSFRQGKPSIIAFSQLSSAYMPDYSLGYLEHSLCEWVKHPLEVLYWCHEHRVPGRLKEAGQVPRRSRLARRAPKRYSDYDLGLNMWSKHLGVFPKPSSFTWLRSNIGQSFNGFYELDLLVILLVL